MSLPDRLVKRLERELIQGKARQRADKKAAARRMRRLISSHLAEEPPADEMEDVTETPIISPDFEKAEELSLPGAKVAILNASKVKKQKGRKAKKSSFSRSPPLPAPAAAVAPFPPSPSPLPSTPPSLPPPPPPSSPSLSPQPPPQSPPPSPQPSPPLPPTPPAQTPAPATNPHLERKIARLEAELFNRDRSRQKRKDAFCSLKNSEHQKMLELIDARRYIEGLKAKLGRLEEELEENKRETVSWVHRAEKFKAERYQDFSHTIDPIPPTPSHAIEWGTLVRKPEFLAGTVGLVALLACGYAAGRYLGNSAPAMPVSCPAQIPCPRPPRVESQRAQLCPKVECPRVECPRAPDCPTGSALPPREKCRGNRHLLASYALGALMGGFSTWQTIQAMD